jgi:hypothetical protein
MSRQPSTLALRESVLQRTEFDGRLTRHPQDFFLDFVVDEESLLERLKASGNLVTPLNRTWLSSVSDALDELRGRRPSPGLADGRVALLVCGGCGDLACGAITASLGVSDEWVTWTDFQWENGIDPPSTTDLTTELGFAFERRAYDTALSGAYGQVAALPYDESAHRSKKILWPWQWGWRLPQR